VKDGGKTGFKKKEWEIYAKSYDALNHLIPYRELQKRISRELGSLSGKKILEAACGTGNLTEIMLKQNRKNNFQIWAIDYSEEMLKIAKQKCQDGRIHFSRTNLNEKMPFADNFFDKIVSVNTLYATRSPEFVLKEFFRVLKSGGRLILETPKMGYENGLILKAHCGSPKPDEYWLDAHSSAERERRLISEAFGFGELSEQIMAVAECNRLISKNVKFNFFRKDELETLLKKAGFSIIKISFVYAEQGILAVAKKGG